MSSAICDLRLQLLHLVDRCSACCGLRFAVARFVLIIIISPHSSPVCKLHRKTAAGFLHQTDSHFLRISLLFIQSTMKAEVHHVRCFRKRPTQIPTEVDFAALSAMLWNHRAIDHIRKSRDKEAVACFERGLAELSNSHFPLISPTSSGMNVVFQPAPPLPCSDTELVSPDGAFQFFNTLLFLRGKVDKPTALGTYLYNLGLVYHRIGIMTASTSNLALALTFYNHALNTAMVHGQDMICFATLNNMGFLFSSLFQFDQMKACQELLMSRKEQFSRLVTPSDYCLGEQALTCAPSA